LVVVEVEAGGEFFGFVGFLFGVGPGISFVRDGVGPVFVDLDGGSDVPALDNTIDMNPIIVILVKITIRDQHSPILVLLGLFYFGAFRFAQESPFNLRAENRLDLSLLSLILFDRAISKAFGD
jgi:hypothetical protein